jgi:hypothetical protein
LFGKTFSSSYKHPFWIEKKKKKKKTKKKKKKTHPREETASSTNGAGKTENQYVGE